MSPRWQRILVSGGLAIGVGAVAVPAVIAYGLVRSNNGGSDAEVAQITSTVTVSATAMTTPRATPSPTLSAVTPEPTPEALTATAQPSLSPPIDEASPAPQEELPPPTSTPPPTPTILPVASSIFVGPGVSFQLVDAEVNGLTVTVDGMVSSRDFKIARIVWNWGDGAIEEDWFPARHTYTRAGRYMLSVSVYDDRGIEIAGQSSPIDLAD